MISDHLHTCIPTRAHYWKSVCKYHLYKVVNKDSLVNEKFTNTQALKDKYQRFTISGWFPHAMLGMRTTMFSSQRV